MERDNRDEDMMLKGTKQEMPGFRFRLLWPEKKRELWNPDFELYFCFVGVEESATRTGSSQSPDGIYLCDQPVSDL